MIRWGGGWKTNIFGIHGFLGGFTKNQFIGGIAQKNGGLGQLVDLRGGLGKKEGVDTTMYTM